MHGALSHANKAVAVPLRRPAIQRKVYEIFHGHELQTKDEPETTPSKHGIAGSHLPVNADLLSHIDSSERQLWCCCHDYQPSCLDNGHEAAAGLGISCLRESQSSRIPFPAYYGTLSTQQTENPSYWEAAYASTTQQRLWDTQIDGEANAPIHCFTASRDWKVTTCTNRATQQSEKVPRVLTPDLDGVQNTSHLQLNLVDSQSYLPPLCSVNCFTLGEHGGRDSWDCFNTACMLEAKCDTSARQSPAANQSVTSRSQYLCSSDNCQAAANGSEISIDGRSRTPQIYIMPRKLPETHVISVGGSTSHSSRSATGAGFDLNRDRTIIEEACASFTRQKWDCIDHDNGCSRCMSCEGRRHLNLDCDGDMHSLGGQAEAYGNRTEIGLTHSMMPTLAQNNHLWQGPTKRERGNCWGGGQAESYHNLEVIFRNLPSALQDPALARFVQHQLATSVFERDHIFRSVEPYSFMLMFDQYGNYVIQALLEYCNQHSKQKLLMRMKTHIMALSLHPHGMLGSAKSYRSSDI